MSSATPLDLGAPPPTGRLAVQASAGTGKTYSLASLAVAYLADGTPVSELLAVTFTRAATAELRSRIRDRLVEVAAHLEHDTTPSAPDPLLERLRRDPAAHLARLQRAATDFDAATVTTIHGFATQVLHTLGATAGTDLDARLVDEGDELVVDVCADVLAQASASGTPAEHLPKLKTLVEHTHGARSTPDVLLEPRPHQPEARPTDVVMAELVGRSMVELRARRLGAGRLSFDDVLVELRAALDGPGRDAVVETLRRRFTVALIDEFQDTDPVQWDVFRTLFGDAGAAGSLVLVGDPKQAIYAFRGANVHTYLDAVAGDARTRRASLDRSWRSDGALLRALDALFEGATFGADDIAFTPVEPAPGNEERRATDPDGEPLAALRLRLVVDPALPRGRSGIAADVAAGACVDDLVAQVRDALDRTRLPVAGAGPRAVRPSDVAVLVRSNADAELAQQALVAHGIPAVLARSGSVLDSEAATHWRWLLEAMARPSDPRRTRAFALSWFVGWTPQQVAEADDVALGRLQEQLQRWAEVLVTSGSTALVRTLWTDTGVEARVLQHADGERAATDLTHVAELLQAPTSSGGASVAGVLGLLDAPAVADPEADKRTDLTARRIETESQAVQVMTVWVAKGLEFPIVCCPTLWRVSGDSPDRYQDPETGRRAIDLASARTKTWPSKEEAAERGALVRREEDGEQLRLLYVALTRARHQTLLWWAPSTNVARSALSRLLFTRVDGRLDPSRLHDAATLPDDADAAAALAPLAARSGGTISVEEGPAPAPRGRWHDPDADPAAPAMAVATLDALPDRTRHRWSFSAITARVETTHFDPADDSLADRGAADEAPPPTHGTTDEPVDDGHDDDTHVDEPAPGPFDLLPAGPTVGTLVHGVLEHVDFTADDLDAALGDALGRELAWLPVDLTPRDQPDATAADGRALLVQALRATVETPLGPDLGGARLRDVAPADRLDELTFELVLGEDGPPATDRALGELVAAHLPAGDPLHRWADGLAAGAFGVDLAGHLTGAIDAVLRLPGPHGPRFVVVDYKTNRLTAHGQAARPEHYAPDALAAAMAAHHYPLQALLYAVALHRFLRWRIADYDPARHLGGIAYLFLRGMTGADVATTGGAPHGVFRWPVPPALVVELSDLLAGRRP